MKNLYIVGSAGSGKTAICVGLALKFKEAGQRVTYFKPVGNVAGLADRTDEDALLMKDLLGMPQSLDTIAPFTMSPHYLARYKRAKENLAKMSKAYKDVAKRADLVITEGTSSLHTMMGIGLDAAALAKKLSAKVLTVHNIANDLDFDAAVFYAGFMRDHYIGSIFNNIRDEVLRKIKDLYRPTFEDMGFKVFGVIPEFSEISAPTVREVADVLGGEVLTGEEHMDLPVEDTLIGAMTLDSALSYFRRTANKAVVTGGDRAEIALAALETSTSTLVLTGGLHPDIKVLARAGEKGVPVLLVPYDTYTTVQKLQSVSRKIKATDAKAINLAKENIERYCEFDEIASAVRGKVR